MRKRVVESIPRLRVGLVLKPLVLLFTVIISPAQAAMLEPLMQFLAVLVWLVVRFRGCPAPQQFVQSMLKICGPTNEFRVLLRDLFQ